MPLDTMPPGPDEPFPDLPEMQSRLPETIPLHRSMWCLINFTRDPDHDPCAGRCGGHGDYRACPHRCWCHCHLRPGRRRGPPPDEAAVRESFRVFPTRMT